MNSQGRLLKLGRASWLPCSQIVLIAGADSEPIQRLIGSYRDSDKLVDLSHGLPDRSVVLTASGYLLLSAVRARTLAARYLEGLSRPEP